MISNNGDKVVYLVDDDSDVFGSLSLFLKASGYNVRSFISAEAFLSNYDNTPACLILDVNMPLTTGLELQGSLLVSEIKIPIIFINGYAKIRNSVKDLSGCPIDFPEKPFESDFFLLRIEEAIKTDIENRSKNKEYGRIRQKLDSLTKKESNILTFILKGFCNKEVAKMMNISPRTVEVHRAHIIEKMKVHHFNDLLLMLKNWF